MNYDRTQRIRRAAILVASLEETLAEQMLESLPRFEAVTILDEVDRLGELDPEEVEDVLDEFRSAGRRGRVIEDSVEFSYSARQQEPTTAVATHEAAAHVANAQVEADAVLMAELLSHESAQTIAAALARLGHDRGAAVFAALPAALQTEVLDRLANLEPADEAAVVELESQLQQRVAQHRQRQDQAAAENELARRILVKTAPAQRESLLARLSLRPSARSEANRVEDVAREEHPMLAPIARPTGAPAACAAAGRFEVWAEEESEVAKPPATADLRQAAAVELADRSRELESLDDRALLEALRVADERTVQCALAASSERFFKRVAGKLPRRQASRLRQVVRSIGPTRLIELREAQHELLRIARDGQAVGVASR